MTQRTIMVRLSGCAQWLHRHHRILDRSSVLILMFIVGLWSVPGCAVRHLPQVMDEIRDGRVSGLPHSPTVTGDYISPESPHGQRYTSVELLQPVYVGTDDEGRVVCSFVLGKRKSDGMWEIVSAAKLNEEGVWQELEVDNERGENLQVAGTKKNRE